MYKKTVYHNIEKNSVRILFKSGHVATLRFNSKRTTQRAYKTIFDNLGLARKSNFNTKNGRVSIVYTDIDSIQQVI